MPYKYNEELSFINPTGGSPSRLPKVTGYCPLNTPPRNLIDYTIIQPPVSTLDGYCPLESPPINPIDYTIIQPPVSTLDGYCPLESPPRQGITPPDVDPISGGSVILLYNFNGTDGDTTTTDSAPFNYTPTFNGTAEISNTQARFGATSLSLPSDGDYISVTPDANNLITGDFTINFWVYRTVAPSVATERGAFFNYAALVNATDTDLSLVENNGNLGVTLQVNTSQTIISSDDVPLNTWVYIGISRAGSTYRLFIDNILQGTNTASVVTLSGDPLNIGVRFDGTLSSLVTAKCFIDDFRIVKDQDLYASGSGFYNNPTTELTLTPPP